MLGMALPVMAPVAAVAFVVPVPAVLSAAPTDADTADAEMLAVDALEAG
jgi:hypothetical protein